MKTKSPPNVIWSIHKKSQTWNDEPEAASPDFIPSASDWEDIECRCVPICTPLEEVTDPSVAKIQALTEAVEGLIKHANRKGDVREDYSLLLYIEAGKKALSLPSA